MDPITLIVSAVVIGVAAGLKPTAETAVQDAYNGFRQIIIDHYQDYRGMLNSLEFVEQDPEDGDGQQMLKKKLETANAAENEELLAAAQNIHRLYRAQDPAAYQTAIGMYIGELKAAELDIDTVQASGQGIDAQIDKADIEGKASFKNIGGARPNP